VDRASDRIALGLRIYDRSFTLERELVAHIVDHDAGTYPALDPNGTTLYLTYRTDLLRYRLSDGVLLDRSINAFIPTAIRMSADGSFVVTTRSDGATSRISVVDLH
jgi:hypothetical protein